MANKKTKHLLSLLILILIILAVVAAFRLGPAWGIVVLLAAASAAAAIALLYLLLRHFTPRSTAAAANLPIHQRPEFNTSFIHRIAGVPTSFPYKELEHATDNFNALVGRGGSGSVFKGILNNGTAVAVKRIEAAEKERGEREFRSEVAAIACVQHVNLVRLLGFCLAPGGPRFLVYEYVEKGSLDGWIFARRSRPGGCLPWRLRCRVALDVAKALSYLHHDCRSRILHLDVKPENILLDGEFRAVVTDFGLSKLMGRDESKIVTRVRGTRGYIAPEWVLEDGISEKSDVYSYGMVILEMIGGRRSIRQATDNRGWEFFPKTLMEKIKEDRLMDAVDWRLIDGQGGVAEEEVRRLAYIGLWCIQEKPRRRPSMAVVVQMLEGHVAVEPPPKTQMIVADFLAVGEEREERRRSGGRQRVAAFDGVGESSSSSSTVSSMDSSGAASVFTGR